MFRFGDCGAGVHSPCEMTCSCMKMACDEAELLSRDWDWNILIMQGEGQGERKRVVLEKRDEVPELLTS